MKTTWAVKAFMNLGSTVTVKNGITTTTPHNGWVEIKRFDDFEEADNWLCDYINKNGYYYGDFKVARA